MEAGLDRMRPLELTVESGRACVRDAAAPEVKPVQAAAEEVRLDIKFSAG